MDIVIVLDRLGYLVGEEQSPSPNLSTYQTMAATWRHTTLSLPTEARMLTEWDVYLTEQAATQYLEDRKTAMQKRLSEVLFKNSLIPILEQCRIDRDAGKTLCPEMNEVINIYSKILTDYPAPET